MQPKKVTPADLSFYKQHTSSHDHNRAVLKQEEEKCIKTNKTILFYEQFLCAFLECRSREICVRNCVIDVFLSWRKRGNKNDAQKLSQLNFTRGGNKIHFKNYKKNNNNNSANGRHHVRDLILLAYKHKRELMSTLASNIKLIIILSFFLDRLPSQAHLDVELRVTSANMSSQLETIKTLTTAAHSLVRP